MSREPEYELAFTHRGPGDKPMVVTEDGEVIAELDLSCGPAIDGMADNLSMNEGVCTKVFDGHHYRPVSPRPGHEPERRECVLCDHRQKRVEEWVDE